MMAGAGNGKRYLIVFTGVFIAVVVAILLLNGQLGERSLGSAAVLRDASAWQQATQGVTYAPPITDTRPFKVLRLADRLPEVNTLVLGSSTVMGITANLLPVERRLYNFSLTGNSTAAVVAEADAVERTPGLSSHIQWLLIGLDWSVGQIYQRDAVTAVDFSVASAQQAFTSRKMPWFKRAEDALTWPRVVNLMKVVRAALASVAPVTALQHTLFDVAGEPYRCDDGTVARDYDTQNPGWCRGYRYDGSWTFARDTRLSAAQAATLALAAAAPSSKYAKSVCAAAGVPNAAYLRRLGEAAQRLATRDGRMIFLLPPLAPGVEQALLNAPQLKPCLARTKTALHEWGVLYQVSIIDAGASERFGCAPGEFSDEHHAYPECYARVLGRYFAAVAQGRVAHGLYTAGAK